MLFTEDDFYRIYVQPYDKINKTEYYSCKMSQVSDVAGTVCKVEDKGDYDKNDHCNSGLYWDNKAIEEC